MKCQCNCGCSNDADFIIDMVNVNGVFCEKCLNCEGVKK